MLSAVLRLLDRYIFKQVFLTCAACVGFFVFLMATVNALKDLLGYLLAGQLALESAVTLLLLLIPYVVVYALPMGMLLGVLLVLGRLSADSEIIAMRTAGLSLRRIGAPIYVLALAGVLAALAVNFYYMPQARTIYRRELSDMLRTNALRMIVPKTFVRDFPKTVVYVSEKHGAYVRDVWLWRLDAQQRAIGFSHAEAGRVDLDEEKNELVFTPFMVNSEQFNEKDPEDYSQPPMRLSAESMSLRVSLAQLFGRKDFNRKLDWLTLDELRDAREKLEKAPTEMPVRERAQKLMRLNMVIQSKSTMAVAVLTLVLIAVPLGIKVSRRETSANLGVALLLALAYYFSTIVVGWFEQYPEFRPDLLIWAPNLVFLCVGVWLNLRVERA